MFILKFYVFKIMNVLSFDFHSFYLRNRKSKANNVHFIGWNASLIAFIDFWNRYPFFRYYFCIIYHHNGLGRYFRGRGYFIANPPYYNNLKKIIFKIKILACKFKNFDINMFFWVTKIF